MNHKTLLAAVLIAGVSAVQLTEAMNYHHNRGYRYGDGEGYHVVPHRYMGKVEYEDWAPHHRLPYPVMGREGRFLNTDQNDAGYGHYYTINPMGAYQYQTEEDAARGKQRFYSHQWWNEEEPAYDGGYRGGCSTCNTCDTCDYDYGCNTCGYDLGCSSCY